jgi:hypothetical protein
MVQMSSDGGVEHMAGHVHHACLYLGPPCREVVLKRGTAIELDCVSSATGVRVVASAPHVAGGRVNQSGCGIFFVALPQ